MGYCSSSIEYDNKRINKLFDNFQDNNAEKMISFVFVVTLLVDVWGAVKLHKFYSSINQTYRNIYDVSNVFKIMSLPNYENAFHWGLGVIIVTSIFAIVAVGYCRSTTIAFNRKKYVVFALIIELFIAAIAVNYWVLAVVAVALVAWFVTGMSA